MDCSCTYPVPDLFHQYPGTLLYIADRSRIAAAGLICQKHSVRKGACSESQVAGLNIACGRTRTNARTSRPSIPSSAGGVGKWESLAKVGVLSSVAMYLASTFASGSFGLPARTHTHNCWPNSDSKVVRRAGMERTV